jgi:hypothetical protein
MYTDVLRWTVITDPNKKSARIVARTRSLALCQLTQNPLVEVRCWLFIHCWREVST